MGYMATHREVIGGAAQPEMEPTLANRTTGTSSVGLHYADLGTPAAQLGGGGGSSSSALDRINAQIKRELETGIVSVEYDLGWRPDTNETLKSGAVRYFQDTMYKFIIQPEGKVETISIPELEKFITENQYKDNENTRTLASVAKDLIQEIKRWKPRNEYYGPTSTYNTKTKKHRDVDASILPAFQDYQAFADELNKTRGNPIRTIYYKSVFKPNGERTLELHWEITKEFQRTNMSGKTEYFTRTYYHYSREYQIEPTFEFLRGTTVQSIREEEEEEKKKKEAEQKAKEDDPIRKLKKQIDELRDQRDKLHRKMYGIKFSKQEQEQAREEIKPIEKQLDEAENQLKKLEKEKKKAKELSDEGQRIKQIDAELKKNRTMLDYNSEYYSAKEDVDGRIQEALEKGYIKRENYEARMKQAQSKMKQLEKHKLTPTQRDELQTKTLNLAKEREQLMKEMRKKK